MHMHVFETCKHFSFSGGSEGNCRARICWSPYGKRNKLMPKHQVMCISTTSFASVPCHEIFLMSLCHGHEKSPREKGASRKKEEKTLLQFMCCQNEVSDALFWLEWEVVYITVLKGGPISVHRQQWHLSGFVNSDLKRKKERERNCIIFNWLTYGFSVWKMEKYWNAWCHITWKCKMSTKYWRIIEQTSTLLVLVTPRRWKSPIWQTAEGVWGGGNIVQLQNKHEKVTEKRKQEVSEWSANHKAGSQLYYEGFADYDMVWA